MLPENFRFYEIEGIKMPSVTAILHTFTPESDGLQNWKKRTPNWTEVLKQKAMVGTIVHNNIAQYFIDKFDLKTELEPLELPIPLPPETEIEASASMGYFDDFTKQYDIVPDGVEDRIWHRKMHYAGRIDFLGKLNGISTLIDFKTSAGIYGSYLAQGVAYKKAILSNPNYKGKVERVVIVMINPIKGLVVGECLDEDIAWDTFWNAYDSFQQLMWPDKLVKKGEV
jgi:hypothetical protein